MRRNPFIVSTLSALVFSLPFSMIHAAELCPNPPKPDFSVLENAGHRRHIRGGGLVSPRAKVAESVTVEENAVVLDDAIVVGNVKIRDRAIVAGSARVQGASIIAANAAILENAHIDGEVTIGGDARICGDAKVGGRAQIFETAEVGAHANVEERAKISGSARIGGSAKVTDSAGVWGSAEVTDEALIKGEAKVSGSTLISGKTIIADHASVFGEGNGTVILRDRTEIRDYGTVIGDVHLSGAVVVKDHAKLCAGPRIEGPVEFGGHYLHQGRETYHAKVPRKTFAYPGPRWNDYVTKAEIAARLAQASAKVSITNPEMKADVSTVSSERVQSLFQKMALEKSLQAGKRYDGCDARASVLANELEKVGIHSAKAFLVSPSEYFTTFGDSHFDDVLSVTVPGEPTLKWTYHVAPVVLVRDPSAKRSIPYVLDPVLFNRAVPATEWTAKILVEYPAEKRAHFFFAHRYTLLPQQARVRLKKYASVNPLGGGKDPIAELVTYLEGLRPNGQ